MDTQNILILLAEWYLNGVLVGYLIYFMCTFRYVLFMRAPSASLIEALDAPVAKRLKIKGMFCGFYPLYKSITLDMGIKVDLTDKAIIVMKDGQLQFGNEVVISGRIMYENSVLKITRIRVLSSTHEQAIKVFMGNKFHKSMLIAFGGSALWTLLQLIL